MRRLLATAAIATICALATASPAAADPPGGPGPDPNWIPTCVTCW